MAGKMDAFDQAIKQIGIDNSSEINGDLKDYFLVTKRADGSNKITWEKNISTHIRHKVTKLVKEYYISKPVK
jgi:hypothetical protein